MNFLSVCSGIEAVSHATVGMWQPVMLSEIESFARTVLRHHYPNTRIWGDFTTLRPRHMRRFNTTSPDLLVGGTPCQSFSLAGLRGSLDDARGNLTLAFVRLANAIDNLRRHQGKRPIVIFWENVPGIFTTKDNAFGCFLSGIVGSTSELIPPKHVGWTDAGMVVGPKRTAAWRVLDAQFFGLAQRRRRVFLVASAGDFDPAKVLFESKGMSGDSPSSGKAQTRVAGPLTVNAGGGGHWSSAESAASEHVIAALQASTGGADDNMAQAGHLVAETLRAGPNTYEDATGRMNVVVGALGTGTGNERHGWRMGSQEVEAGHLIASGLRSEGHDASEDGSGRTNLVVSRALLSHPPRTDYDTETFVAVFDRAQITNENNRATVEPDKPSPTISKDSQMGVVGQFGVRRLMPVEMERLMGFPDGYTAVKYRRGTAADGPRAAALGNSMAVPVVRWIAERITREYERTI